MHKIIDILIIIWQLPQCLAGIAVGVVTRAEFCYLSGIKFWITDKFCGGVALGEVIIFGQSGHAGYPRMLDIRHEYGHVRQSRMLGPLYLPIVGIWSGVRAWLNLYKRGHYYDTWTERWADRLGGIVRDDKGRRRILP